MWYYLLLLVLGLVIGSFLSAYTYRFPKGISVFWGRSVCPTCGKKISWYDNIPLLSFFLLGGRCRVCKRPISLRYPAIELGTALVFLGAGYFFSLTFLPAVLFFAGVLIFLFVIDLENKTIPDTPVFFALVVSYSLLLLISAPDFYARVAAGFIASLFLLSINLITRGRGMGLGDVKFALFGGTIAGLALLPAWLFIAFLTGAAVGVILILVGKAKLKSAVAFGPFLIVALGLTALWGEKIFILVLQFLSF